MLAAIPAFNDAYNELSSGEFEYLKMYHATDSSAA
jgi:hypothetical protein